MSYENLDQIVILKEPLRTLDTQLNESFLIDSNSYVVEYIKVGVNLKLHMYSFLILKIALQKGWS